jgi:uncharacterized repeat protein (TIGR01451 family)
VVPISIEPLADLDITLMMRVVSRPLTSVSAALAGTGVVREYIVKITNAGPSAATNVILSATLPLGATLERIDTSQGECAGTTEVRCAIGTLANGADLEVTFLLSDAPDQGAPDDLRLRLTADQTDPSPVDGITPPQVSPTYTIFLPTISR